MLIVSYSWPATAIPSITSEFNTLNDVGWYGSAYLLSGSALQPTYGKIYTYFHVKWTYLSALLLFEVGSAICAAASSSVIFIIGRAVAGLGSAGLRSGASTIIAISVPIHKRGLFNSSLATSFGSKIFSSTASCKGVNQFLMYQHHSCFSHRPAARWRIDRQVELEVLLLDQSSTGSGRLSRGRSRLQTSPAA